MRELYLFQEDKCDVANRDPCYVLNIHPDYHQKASDMEKQLTDCEEERLRCSYITVMRAHPCIRLNQ